DFWALVRKFPKTERAIGYLMAKSGSGPDEVEPDDVEASDIPGDQLSLDLMSDSRTSDGLTNGMSSGHRVP
ncbi:MAG: hypothetical protein ACKOBT_02515, partial [Actinomycetota bacterium]